MLLSEPKVLEASCFETKRSRFARCIGLCHSLVLRATQLSTVKVTKQRIITVPYRKTIGVFRMATALSSQHSARDTPLGNTDNSYRSLPANEEPYPAGSLKSATDLVSEQVIRLTEKFRCYVNPNFKNRIHKSQSKLNLHPQIPLILS